MPKIFRAMKSDDGHPKIEDSARGLGVRPIDLPVGQNGLVRPNSGGMSVAPRWRDLPPHRIPMRLRSKGAPDAVGNNQDACWSMGQGPFDSGPLTDVLHLAVDSSRHGTVQPVTEMPMRAYKSAIGETSSQWQIDEA